MLLIEKLSSSLVNPIADTLFPLIIASPAAYAEVARGIIAGTTDEREKSPKANPNPNPNPNLTL